MARGITEIDVHTAADEIVAAGERPTVERIRAHLGTGSPNTVTRWLETWWQRLGERLTAQQTKLALPEAPAEVTLLASQLWEQALLAARAEALASVAADRQELERERATLDAAREKAREELATQQRAVETAQHTLALTEARLTEIQQLAEYQASQIRDLTQQRDVLHARSERQDAELIALAERLKQQETAAAVEREAQVQHLRASEDRAHAEVDRARQEAKELRTQLTTLARERTVSEQGLRQQRDEAVTAAAVAQREAGLQRGRGDALEQQLARLGDLPATLQATLAQARTPAGRRGTVGSTTGKRAVKRKQPV